VSLMNGISFVIVNWNGGQVFEECLWSITSNIKEFGTIDYEIVVVDNGSKDLDVSKLSQIPRLHLVRNRLNRFFAYGTNQAVHASKGECLFILNNDIWFPASSIVPMYREYLKDLSAIYAPRLLNIDGSIQKSIRGLPTSADLIYSSLSLGKLSARYDHWKCNRFNYSARQLVEQPMFSLLILSRNTWDLVGDMDVQFSQYFNDVDWFYRAKLSRVRTFFVPGCSAVHHHGFSVQRHSFKRVFLSTIGMYRYLTKIGQYGVIRQVLCVVLVSAICGGRLLASLGKIVKRLIVLQNSSEQRITISQ